MEQVAVDSITDRVSAPLNNLQDEQKTMAGAISSAAKKQDGLATNQDALTADLGSLTKRVDELLDCAKAADIFDATTSKCYDQVQTCAS